MPPLQVKQFELQGLQESVTESAYRPVGQEEIHEPLKKTPCLQEVQLVVKTEQV